MQVCLTCWDVFLSKVLLDILGFIEDVDKELTLEVLLPVGVEGERVPHGSDHLVLIFE